MGVIVTSLLLSHRGIHPYNPSSESEPSSSKSLSTINPLPSCSPEHVAHSSKSEEYTQLTHPSLKNCNSR